MVGVHCPSDMGSMGLCLGPATSAATAAMIRVASSYRRSLDQANLGSVSARVWC